MKKTALPTTREKLKSDRLLILALIALLAFGVVAVYDVSVVTASDVFGGKYYFLILQSIWAVLGLAGFYIAFKTDYHKIVSLGPGIFFISLLLLLPLAVSSFLDLDLPFFPRIYGAYRWFYINPNPFPRIPIIGRLSFQPSELMKLGLILYFTRLFVSNKGGSMIVRFLVVTGLAFLLVLSQPDFGTAILIAGISLSMFFITEPNLLFFVLGFPLAFSAALLFILVSSYRRQRLLTFLNQGSSDPQGAGYHINQILIALGSGGLFGVGFGQSRQKHQYIPEVTTDSILAILGEELGFIGLLVLVGLFLLLIVRGFGIAKRANDLEGKLLACGITSWFAVQTFVNLSSMVHLIPLTGVPLPLVSYGGSSLVFMLFGFGILANVSRG